MAVVLGAQRPQGDADYLGGIRVTADGLPVRGWAPADTVYRTEATGPRRVREGVAGWGRRQTHAVALPDVVGAAQASAALELALQRIVNRWKPSIVLHVAERPQRRRDLERRLPRDVRAKVPPEQLRALEADGLVYRVDRTPAGHGRHVTYALTALGGTRGPAVTSLAAWTVEHSTDLLPRRRDLARTRGDER